MLRDCRTAGRPDLLHPSVRAWLGLIAVLAALVVVALGLLYAGVGEPGAVDARLSALVDRAGPTWRHVALATDFLGEPLGAAALVAAAVAGCLALRSPRAAVLVVAATGISVGATKLLKPVVARTIHGENLSFPSGHTAFLTAFALVVALLATGRLGLGRPAGTALVLTAALLAGGAMGWAQVLLGAHYPTDTLGGFCTALAVVPATAWLVDRTADRRAERNADRADR
ncbi:integral membrane protein [Streptomyces venezuelae]|uniref:phosphatase PAP2 family protein n=1 Tax=Streptomyces gardneri TaxID=66892 RepID=UPI0006BD442B|nr:phosphatase PAP2 family protein [Streptomyces gardneri]ALO13076.1 integral membrane protein [Streptomyces venezuelae]QPK49749.1 phosphatase PAP2 family protein [Streptomyces gardneri]CUM36252.1 putative integral membrane protein [Streptomyces venezuelae]